MINPLFDLSTDDHACAEFRETLSNGCFVKFLESSKNAKELGIDSDVLQGKQIFDFGVSFFFLFVFFYFFFLKFHFF